MTNEQWALRALRVAQTRAAGKATTAEAAATLGRGVRTAASWLDGSHPKAT
jgi:hypothetical protein